MNFIDMTGWVMKEHGYPTSRLTVLQRDQTKTERVYWICQCECGTIKSIRASHIRGHILSCGCLKKETFSNIVKKDLTNKRFGRLLVLKDSNKRNKQGHIIWLCKCDCGNICEVSSHELLQNDTHSCGCLGTSYGEFVIETILKNNNITYEQEKTFPNLHSPKGSLLRYDFYLPDKKILIEFDGIQHYEPDNYLNQNNYIYRQQCDRMKNQYAKDNELRLYRIPYTAINKITIKTLFNEEYLIND